MKTTTGGFSQEGSASFKEEVALFMKISPEFYI